MALSVSACIQLPEEFEEDVPQENQQTQTTNEPSVNNEGRTLNLPVTAFNYANIPLPLHYLQNQYPANMPFQSAAVDNDNTPDNNPISDAGATLGRVLFYDTHLSANGTVSCASCHLQAFAFSDPNRLSRGFAGGLTRRHSMGLSNARFYASGKFFWGERADTLEQQVLMPIQDEVEMGMDLTSLVSVVSSQDFYPALFIDAFGDNTISSDRIARALAQFVRSIVSTRSLYDVGRAQVNSPLDDFPNFSRSENLGKRLFNNPGQNLPPVRPAMQVKHLWVWPLRPITAWTEPRLPTKALAKAQETAPMTASLKPRACAISPCAHPSCTMAALIH